MQRAAGADICACPTPAPAAAAAAVCNGVAPHRRDGILLTRFPRAVRLQVANALSSAQGEPQGALEFERCQLATAPFATPLPQPLTIMLVARARGDVTLIDALTPRSPRFEVCHGYPTADIVSRSAPHVCMTAHGSGEIAPEPKRLLRGRTRSTDAWHLYTCIFDGDKSELYVDGIKEAGGKAVGHAHLDGIRIGCDHTGTFFLTGMMAELRIFSCHLCPTLRAQLEAAMALRYGLQPATKPAAAAAACAQVGIRLRRASSS